ncbi:FirrV-1-O1 [Feldmannia irregularis virus a]|uniref:FirrV-1-O1 n=1 Tax=Feldmannia irregularis virus a TaxID=231992 RepID=Q6XLT3_9PHYC|nr:FirrV-1-O1 [Feldmannia irregularis virus a]AAR26978.1 FirrV-1-O1 [Feldmannia irregularis virus a]
MARAPVTHIESDIAQRSDEAWGYQYHVRDQNFVLLSICDNESSSDCPSAIKVFGTYRTLDEANRAAGVISNENDFFDVYVADTNAWLPIPPSSKFIEDVRYQEERLKDIKDTFTKMKDRNANQMRRQITKSDGLEK